MIGTIDLDKTFEERDLISAKVVEVLDSAGGNLGDPCSPLRNQKHHPTKLCERGYGKTSDAEREKRAILAKSEGDKQSRINMSEGKKMEMINISEGEMQKKINEAEGKAEEILTISKCHR